MVEHDFNWIPLFVLLTWIVTSGFMWLNSAKGRAPGRGVSMIERYRAFAGFFKQVPSWHKRGFERILNDAMRDHDEARWLMLDRQAKHVAFRNGVVTHGAREHFIVACLWFFDRPADMRAEWPALYEHMTIITGKDPLRARRALSMEPQAA